MSEIHPVDFAKQTIDALYEKYEKDTFIFSKMHNYVCFKLPEIIDEIKRTDTERRERNNQLSSKQELFIKTFLHRNPYFYCASTERYFYYDQTHYHFRKEDDILYDILTTITKEYEHLIPRKPQTKVFVMKRIKDSNPLKSIPESKTIQSVIDSLYPSVFETKAGVKYFLSILGDHLLNKTDETSHVYFTTLKAKEFLKELGDKSLKWFGVNATSSFKHKYHGHSFDSIRLVRMSEQLKPIVDYHLLDLFCVAAHYSDRYESADNYLTHFCEEPELVQTALHFKGENENSIFEEFAIDFHEDKGPRGSIISPTTMEYLWRQYLKEKQYPNVLNKIALLEHLKRRFAKNYDEERDVFYELYNFTSHCVNQCTMLWDEHIEETTEDLCEYELSELLKIFDYKVKETNFLDFIRFYKTHIDITDIKRIKGIRCKSWNKKQELKLYFDKLLSECEYPISISDCYTTYLSLKKTQKEHLVVSKAYFNKYAYILHNAGDGFIHGET